MKRITENAYAKINLTLDVKGESFGFHLLDMLGRASNCTTTSP